MGSGAGRKRGPGLGLAAGVVIIGIMVVLALAAPILATDLPIIARSPAGLVFPALNSSNRLPLAVNRDLEPVLMAPVPYSPFRIDLENVLAPPSAEHWLGTDGLGRDLTARVLHGTRISLAVGILSAVLALLAGVPLGALAGYIGGICDAAVSRLMETVLCFPALLLLLALLTTAPDWLRELPDVIKISLVLALTGWIPAARYLRAEFIRLLGSDVVAAARAAGAGHLRIVYRHILPSAMAPVLVTASFAVAGAIILEASLSFLGLGVQPPTAAWGSILTEAATHIDRAWWMALFPGAALFTALLACNLIGEGLRDLLDPRS